MAETNFRHAHTLPKRFANFETERQNILTALCLCVALCASSLSAANEPGSPAGDAATKSGTYTNDYFGFSFSFPRSCIVVQQSAPHEFQAAGGDILVRDGILKRGVVTADQQNTHNLLKITNRLDPFRGYVPSITIVAEGIHDGAPFNNAEEYIAHTAKFFTRMRTPIYTLAEPARAVVLGGRPFYRAEFRAEWPDGTVRQFYYAQLIKGFAVSIIVSARDKDQLARMDRILQELRFVAPK